MAGFVLINVILFCKIVHFNIAANTIVLGPIATMAEECYVLVVLEGTFEQRAALSLGHFRKRLNVRIKF